MTIPMEMTDASSITFKLQHHKYERRQYMWFIWRMMAHALKGVNMIELNNKNVKNKRKIFLEV